MISLSAGHGANLFHTCRVRVKRKFIPIYPGGDEVFAKMQIVGHKIGGLV
jgi:hypothetical protein